jgi:hypothetical protein
MTLDWMNRIYRIDLCDHPVSAVRFSGLRFGVLVGEGMDYRSYGSGSSATASQGVMREVRAFFMLELLDEEIDDMVSQNVIPGLGKLGGARRMAFTEQGVAMLSSVLRSSRAVEVNIAIMRTFVQLRRLMDGNRDLARKIKSLEKKYDEQFKVVFEAIRQLIAADSEEVETKPRRRIGFNQSC